MYGKQGQFIAPVQKVLLLKAKKIPLRFLELLLPATDLRGKTVLIYRDGWFRGKEVDICWMG
jgi:hypothetical protein